jgi:hypothetical protein
MGKADGVIVFGLLERLSGEERRQLLGVTLSHVRLHQVAVGLAEPREARVNRLSAVSEPGPVKREDVEQLEQNRAGTVRPRCRVTGRGRAMSETAASLIM